MPTEDSRALAADPSLALNFPWSNTIAGAGVGNAAGGAVSVTVEGNITTTGANAHGIFAQSIGAGGGIAAGGGDSASAAVLAGTTARGAGTTYQGEGGTINITHAAGSTIRTSGLSSIGIIAQTSGTVAGANVIDITIGGSVIGGTYGGAASIGVGSAGMLLTGGGNSSGNPNTITVQSDGSVSMIDGANGTAITTGYGVTNVSNAGTITGSINLGGTPGTITNAGLLNTGPTVVTSTLTNSGPEYLSQTGSLRAAYHF